MLFQKYIQTHICIYIHSPHRCLELKSRNSFSFGGLGLPLQGYVRVILAINTPATCMEHHRGTCQGMDQLKEMRAKLRRLKWTTGGAQELSMGRFGMACLCVHSCLQLYKWTIVIAFCFIFWNFWKFTTFRGYWCHWCLCWRPKTSWCFPRCWVRVSHPPQRRPHLKRMEAKRAREFEIEMLPWRWTWCNDFENFQSMPVTVFFGKM